MTKQTPPSAFTFPFKCNTQPRQIAGFTNGNSQLKERCSSLTDLPIWDIHLHQTTIIQSSTLHCHLAPLKPPNTAYKARRTEVLLSCTRKVALNCTSRSSISNSFTRRDERVKALAPKQHRCFKCTLASQFCFTLEKDDKVPRSTDSAI